MKKFILAITAFIYLSAAAGATIHLHYCMGKLVGWDMKSSKADKCGKCGMEKNDQKGNNCCKDEHKKFQLNDDQDIVSLSYSLLQLPGVTGTAVIPEFTWFIIQEDKDCPVDHGPPFEKILPLYLRCCVFRI